MIEDTKQATPSATDEVQQDTAVTVADQPEPAEPTNSATTGEASPSAGEPTTNSAAPDDAVATADEPAAPATDEVAADGGDAAAEPAAASVDTGAPATDDGAATVEAEAVTGDAEPATPEAATAESAPAAEEAPRSEPMTMAELLDDPDNEVKSLKHGDVVEGTVVRIDPDEILIDFGGKSEGVVSNRELMNRRGPRDSAEEARPEIQVGSEVLVYVLQPESPEGHAVLSLRRAGLERKWRAMQERFDAGEIVEARVIDHNKGGLIV
ncbi:MAG TPA: S1 RNA-binding domain-containing protein, partial [Candidatus Limnocylindria bacterium]|nr:S1 RNA-binding domain-containing protein [Candidatus Limnocylindria bacterium]